MRSTALFAATILSLATACGTGDSNSIPIKDGGTDQIPQSSELASLAITGPSTPIAVGSSDMLTATGTYGNGNKQDVTSKVVWTTSAATVATVSNAGIVTASAAGVVTIRAELGGKIGSIELTITPSVVALSSVQVSTTADSVEVGDTLKLTASATYSDGSKSDVSAKATWSSSDPAIATVSQGAATGVSPGNVVIKATLDGKESSSTITVKNKPPIVLPSALSVTAPANLAVGATAQLAATATYSDSSKKDVSSSATWSSSNTAIATISAAGVVTAVAPGSATVKATLAGKEATATITVDSALTLSTLSVTAPASTLSTGATATLVATATYSDSSKKDVSSSVTWSSSNTAVATVSAAGVVTGVADGSATIKASLSGKDGVVTLSVTKTEITITNISIAPAAPSTPVGLKVQLTASATYSDGSKQDISKTATWKSESPSVATVSDTGLVTAVAAGAAKITATAGGKVASADFTALAIALVSMDVTPATASIPAGTTQQFVATGTYNDGSKKDLTTQAEWTSSAGTMATVADAAGSKGLATGLAKGAATVTAALGGKTGRAELTVTDVQLTTIVVTPAKPTLITAATTVALTAMGTYTDKSSKNITAEATWTTSNSAFATVSNAAGSNGLVTGVAAGAATITATLQGKHGAATVQSVNASLDSITLTPADSSLPKGAKKQFTAIGHYKQTPTSQAIDQDITNLVTWLSSSSAAATVENGGQKDGLVTAVAPGNTVISAALAFKTASTKLTVTGISLQSISITTERTSIAKGTTGQFAATGIYSDGSKQTLTADVTWKSSATNIAVISNDGATDGLATALAAGTATITATLGTVSATATLTVTNATLSSIAIDPTTASIVDGTVKAFKAVGTFSDNATQDITTQVGWASSDNAVATISNAAAHKGEAQGESKGQSTITAALFGKAGAATLTVTDAVATKIRIVPATPKIAKGSLTALAAKATYTDGSETDVTNAVTWISSDTTVATISNDSGTRGQVMGVAAGTSVIGIAQGELSATVTLTVTAVTLTTLTIAPATGATVKVGETRAFTATGTFSDNSSQDLTLQAAWTSSNNGLATISSGNGTDGRASGVAVGAVTIGATALGKTATAVPLTIAAR